VILPQKGIKKGLSEENIAFLCIFLIKTLAVLIEMLTFALAKTERWRNW
jgi:hypothetical protein